MELCRRSYILQWFVSCIASQNNHTGPHLVEEEPVLETNILVKQKIIKNWSLRTVLWIYWASQEIDNHKKNTLITSHNGDFLPFFCLSTLNNFNALDIFANTMIFVIIYWNYSIHEKIIHELSHEWNTKQEKMNLQIHCKFPLFKTIAMTQRIEQINIFIMRIDDGQNPMETMHT